jgi:predicted methyltransferase MtxX (methanogen marker protein 4)
MENELEQKLRLVEAAIEFYRNHLMSEQSLMSVLTQLYNTLGKLERGKKVETIIKKGEIKLRKK